MIPDFTVPLKVSQGSSPTAGNILINRRTGLPAVEGSVSARRKADSLRGDPCHGANS